MHQMTIGAGARIEPGYSSSPFEPSRPPITELSDINLVDPELYQYGDPHASWRVLRRQAPVFWNEQGTIGTEGKGFWAVTRYEEFRRVLRDHEYFSSIHSPFLDTTAEMMAPDMMLCMDPPRHRQLRKVTQMLFTTRRVNEWQDELTSIADRLIDAVIERGECEFASEIAVKFPVYAACALLGVSNEEADQVTEVSLKLHSSENPAALVEFNEVGMGLFQRLIADRRDDPGPGVVGAILAGETDEGAPLTESEIFAYLWLLFVGGLDSATHASTASVQTFFHYPEQMRLLRSRDDIWDTAVEELLRWTSLSQHLKRYVVQDTELGGKRLRKGDYIAVFQPSANRDETAFPNPYRIDLTRRMDNIIATFGDGPHTCIGLHYARLELKSLLRQVLHRMPDIAPAAPMVRGRGFTVSLSPIHRQPVTFAPGPRIAA